MVCFDQDVFVNAVGGVKIGEPAADLAVLLAIVFMLEKQAVAQGAYGLWRGWPGRRDPPGAARPGAPEGGRQAGLHAWRWCPKPTRPSRRFRGMGVIAVERIEEARERLRELASPDISALAWHCRKAPENPAKTLRLVRQAGGQGKLASVRVL